MNQSHIIPVLFGIGTVVSWDFVIQYGFRAKWFSHIYGRINMVFMTIVALILTFVVVNSFFKEYPGRDLIRYSLLVAFMVGLIVLDVFLHRQLKKDSTHESIPGSDSSISESDR